MWVRPTARDLCSRKRRFLTSALAGEWHGVGMTPDYCLHYAPDNASLVIRLALEELGVDYETALVDRASHAQRSAAYKALNPSGKIPTLETPDGPISETAAILLYLADRHGVLAPSATAPDRAAFLKWLFFISNTLHPALRMLFYTQTYVGNDQAAKKALVIHARKHVQDGLDQLEAVLGTAPHWFGQETPSILDFYAAGCWRWVQVYPPGYTAWMTPASWPKLLQNFTRLEARPSALKVATAEGLGAHPFSAPAVPNPPEGTVY